MVKVVQLSGDNIKTAYTRSTEYVVSSSAQYFFSEPVYFTCTVLLGMRKET